MRYIVWERPEGSKYEQPICFDLTKEQAEDIAGMCPVGYSRTVEVSPPEIDLWLELSKEIG